MTDRFKFRVWDKEFNKYWTDEEIKENAAWLLFPDNDNIENIEFEQCTGIKDANGKIIYEGDILDVPFEGFDGKNFDMRDLLCVVVYFNGSFMFRDKYGNYRYFDETEFAILDKELFAAEIVGNVHESEEFNE